ncbi:hypothetical protein DFJ58DRAFT_643105, partial [Suillus subalutaceus]|uniref:uncharacterized protein n=1 Tax=Suillus subalutaceus TaxID=48586 RepID=UPI001B87A4B8
SESLVMPCEKGEVSYSLKGVLYSSQQHFSAHLINDETVWKYDGQQNNGSPQEENTSATDMRNLSGRPAIVYIYA